MASNKDKDDKQHIQVFARIRPFNAKEKAHNAKPYLKVHGKEVHVPQSHGSKRYMFDKVFDMHSRQSDIYDHAISPIILEVLKGYNCTVFAYGQTGSGKTHTMVGPDVVNEPDFSINSDVGIIPRAMSDIFDSLHKQADLDFTIRVSYLEIYNEVLNDLLSAEEKTLRIYEDPKNKSAVQIHGLEEVTVRNKKDVYTLLKSGADKRKMASTYMNQHSSRSHSVFTITIHMKETTPEGDQLVKTGKLNLVDLAGSENIQRSGAVDQRAREAGNINQSLLTLGRVIKALVEKLGHVPYRESKLTRILQDSLGGKTKTAIIATTSPAISNLEETISTLDYAFRARNILTKPEVNQKYCKQSLIKKYLEEIDNLKKDLNATRKGDGIYMHPDNYEMMQQESSKVKDDYIRAVAECAEFQTRFVELQRQCNELEEVYSDTKLELLTSKQSLTKSKIALKKLRIDRHIRKELIDKYTDCEIHHFKNSKEMSMALDQHIREHNFLCSKMDQFYSAMKVNEDAMDTLDKEHNYFQHNMQDCYHELASEETRQFDELVAYNSKFVEKHSSNHLNLVNAVGTMSLTSVDAINTLAKQSKTGLDSIMTHLTQNLQISDEHVASVKKHIQNELKIFENSQQIGIQCIQEHCNALNVLIKEGKEIVEDLKNELIDRNKCAELNHKAIKSELITSIAKLSAEINEIKQPIEEAKIEEEKMMRLFTEYIQKKQDTYQMHQSKVDSALNTCNNFHMPFVNSLQEEQKVSDANVHETLKKYEEVNKVFEGTRSLTSSFIDTMPSKVNDITKRNEMAIKLTKDMMDSNITRVHRDYKQLQNYGIKYNETIHADVQKYTKQVEDNLTECSTHIEGIKSDIASHVLGVNDIAKNSMENTKSEMLAWTNNVSKLCTRTKNVINSIKTVKQTGETPARKERITYEVPRKINAKVLQYDNDLDLSSISVLDESLTECNGRPSLEFFEPSDPEYQYEGEYVSVQCKDSLSSTSSIKELEDINQLDA